MQRSLRSNILGASRSLRSHRFSTTSAFRNYKPNPTHNGPQLTPIRFGNPETIQPPNAAQPSPVQSGNPETTGFLATPQLTPVRFANDLTRIPKWQEESFFMRWTTYISVSMCFALAGVYAIYSGNEITTPEQLPERRRLQPTLGGQYLYNEIQHTYARGWLGIPDKFQYLQPPLTLPDDDPIVIAARKVLVDLLRANRVQGRVYPPMQNIRAYVVDAPCMDTSVYRP